MVVIITCGSLALWWGMPAARDLTGLRFGRLVAIRLDGHFGRARAWLCRCDCGVELRVRMGCLVTGNTRSCGCYSRERASETAKRVKRVHGMKGTPEHNIWSSMRARCHDARNPKYARWGGRGIRVCERWQSFEAFLADMGPRPGPGYSLDRIDNNGDYEPGNCRWATAKEQASNTRRNRYVELSGERMTLSEFLRRYGLGDRSVRVKLALGMTAEQIVARVRRPRMTNAEAAALARSIS